MQLRTLSLIFLIFSSLAYADKSRCQRALLSPEQLSVIREAQKGEYEIYVNYGKVNGVLRTVVVLGEAHVKSEEDSELGKKVVDQFQVAGVEGADAFKKGIVGRAVGSATSALYKIYEAFGMKPSTIKYAVERAEAEPDLRRFIRIEEGHTLSTSEKIKLVVLSATMIPGTARAGFYLYTTGCLLHESIATWDAVPLAFAGLLLLKIMPITEWILNGLADFVGFNSLKRRLVHDTLCATREPHMAKTVSESLKADDSIKKMLVIVGMNHAYPLTRLLEKEYGLSGLKVRN